MSRHHKQQETHTHTHTYTHGTHGKCNLQNVNHFRLARRWVKNEAPLLYNCQSVTNTYHFYLLRRASVPWRTLRVADWLSNLNTCELWIFNLRLYLKVFSHTDCFTDYLSVYEVSYAVQRWCACVGMSMMCVRCLIMRILSMYSVYVSCTVDLHVSYWFWSSPGQLWHFLDFDLMLLFSLSCSFSVSWFVLLPDCLSYYVLFCTPYTSSHVYYLYLRIGVFVLSACSVFLVIVVCWALKMSFLLSWDYILLCEK